MLFSTFRCRKDVNSVFIRERGLPARRQKFMSLYVSDGSQTPFGRKRVFVDPFLLRTRQVDRERIP